MDRWHDFWQIATPKLFEWLEWAAVLGALSYVNNRHPSILLTLLVLLGYAGLIFYFGGFFVRRSIPIPWFKSKLTQIMVGELIAVLLGTATALLIEYAVAALSSGTS